MQEKSYLCIYQNVSLLYRFFATDVITHCKVCVKLNHLLFKKHNADLILKNKNVVYYINLFLMISTNNYHIIKKRL